MPVGFSFLLAKTVFLFFSSFSVKNPLFSKNAAPLFLQSVGGMPDY
jgi:hypothetical protein